ncbi:cyanidin 3-O-galactoside 2''-O-xylosyltransferase FGGT1-like [Salvia miltiorrhiza]|uniref:cyanidin 3-O-galactoside 2''-O-xylosyltransferase FGGT1-like n=1 Tax=Salvia miltiorrhiza TaxID=226208 RepID=UPI0025AD7E99|nr:cyanidin 3-O-galactoside 2''-O-xylosyltransferase FGGT1-like [Salvia miltiorrhiza]
MEDKRLKIIMYPWLAMGHLTSFLHISNKLAERGHRIWFLLPPKTQPKLEQFNLHPQLITFIPLSIPHLQGLPAGAETTADVPFHLHKLLRRAMDLTQPAIEHLLHQLKPHFIFFDFTPWLPALARRFDVKSIHYCTISPAAVAYMIRDESSADAFMEPPPGFPSSAIKLRDHEARALLRVNKSTEFDGATTFVQRMLACLEECDALGFRSCREMEGRYCDFLEKKFEKPVMLAGFVVPEAPSSSLDEKWRKWLDQFDAKSVVYCAFGSEARLRKDEFEQVVLGLELTGLPFLAALKAETVEEEGVGAVGFGERRGRGVVVEGWVQQQLILKHPSVGCFVTHCGSGSLSEGMVSECGMVAAAHGGDQVINARMAAGEWRVGAEAGRDEKGLLRKEGVAEAVKVVMGMGEGSEMRANHGKWRELLLGKGFEDSYMDGFVRDLLLLLH